MPHLFVNRKRLMNLAGDPADLPGHFRWETINAILYTFGGLVFIVGSILFFPRFAAHADLGAWTFFFGSLIYLVVTGHDLLESLQARRLGAQTGWQHRLTLAAAITYNIGTLLFIAGSLLFLSWIDRVEASAWCFISGSLLFVLGACINVLQIVRERSLATLQLMNLTAISFIVGALLFTVASVPYLWHIQNSEAQRTLYAFLAWQYLVGSLLFFLGGLFNYWRAYLLVQTALAEDPSDDRASPPLAVDPEEAQH